MLLSPNNPTGGWLEEHSGQPAILPHATTEAAPATTYLKYILGPLKSDFQKNALGSETDWPLAFSLKAAYTQEILKP